MLAPAALALKPRHARLEHPAQQELPELPLDELRQPCPIPRRRRRAQERLQMLPDHLMQHGVLGVSRTIQGHHASHAPAYRVRRALPMPKDGYAGSASRRDDGPHLMKLARVAGRPALGSRSRGAISAGGQRAVSRTLPVRGRAARLAARDVPGRCQLAAHGITALCSRTPCVAATGGLDARDRVTWYAQQECMSHDAARREASAPCHNRS